MTVIDMRSEPNLGELSHLVSAALETLESTDEALFDFVRDHVQLLIAGRLSRSGRAGTSPWTYGYITPFAEPERSNSALLAIHLVWAAEHNYQFHRTRQKGAKWDALAVAHSCHDRQLAFARQLPNAADWIEYLQLQQPAPEA